MAELSMEQIQSAYDEYDGKRYPEEFLSEYVLMECLQERKGADTFLARGQSGGLCIAKCYDKFRQSRVVKGCMSGLKPAVVGLIANAVLNVLMTVFFPAGLTLAVFTTPAFYIYLGIFGVMLLLAFKKVHPIIIVCLSAAIGIGVGYLGF